MKYKIIHFNGHRPQTWTLYCRKFGIWYELAKRVDGDDWKSKTETKASDFFQEGGGGCEWGSAITETEAQQITTPKPRVRMLDI